jgi:diguanylate cyclase (GGDEF)-like protein
MLILILALWLLATISGLCWSRVWTIALSGVSVLLFAILMPTQLLAWTGWVFLLLLVGFPWLFAAEQARATEALRVGQRQQAERMSRLSESARTLLALEASSHQMERQITELTELYHVTKETSRALHGQELFAALLDLAPRMLSVKGLRLLDLSGPAAAMFRAGAGEHGRLSLLNHGALEGAEADLSDRVRSAQPGFGESVSRDRLLGPLAWVTLWQEQRPIGALIAEDLQEAQDHTFRVIANQVGLQLSRVRLYQQVESLAVTDALTGLFVRRHFLERAEEELTRSRRHKLSCAMLMIDLDHFKSKNDTHGHLVGDVVLRSVAGLVQQHLRDVDLMARFGGEEFILLLIETPADQALAVAERLRQLVEVHAIQAYDELLNQTISVGIALFPEHGNSLQELIDRADQALLAAKRSGRNRVVLAQAGS